MAVQVVLPARVGLQGTGRELTLCSAITPSYKAAPEEEHGPRAGAVRPQHAAAMAALPARPRPRCSSCSLPKASGK